MTIKELIEVFMNSRCISSRTLYLRPDIHHLYQVLSALLLCNHRSVTVRDRFYIAEYIHSTDELYHSTYIEAKDIQKVIEKYYEFK